MTDRELIAFLETLDPAHLAYAKAYAEELSLGEPEPYSTGLDPVTVRLIRRKIRNEWRNRIKTMGRTRR